MTIRTQCNWHLNEQFAGWIVAEELDRYRRRMLATALQPGPLLTEEAVARGEAEIGVSGSLTRVRGAIEHGLDLVVLGAQYHTLPVGVVGLATSRPTIADLAGARLGVPVSAVELERYMHRAGHDAFVPVHVESGVDELLAGTIDFLYGYRFNQPLEIARRGVACTFTSLAELGHVEPGGVVFCRRAWLEARRQQAVQYLAATIEGWAIVESDPASATAIVNIAARRTGRPVAHAERCRLQLHDMGRAATGDLFTVDLDAPWAHDVLRDAYREVAR